MPSNAKIMSEMIPTSILKIFNKCGHALTTDVNEKYIKLVKQFLTGDNKTKPV
jgi:pimeloyl-ACP methyl ester carboxylesterase